MDKETENRELTYKAFLLYTLLGGCCLINLMNYFETCRFNDNLKSQVLLCHKILKKKNLKIRHKL